MLDLKKIIQYPAPASEYYKEVFGKTLVVVHHTASGGNPIGDMDYLNTDKQGAVNCALFIGRDGKIYQAFSTKYWSNHLGVPQSTFTKFKVNNTCKKLHQKSVAIELDSWGWLELGGYTNPSGKWVAKEQGKFYSYAAVEVKAENVITYPEGYLGKKYYEKYTELQIKALEDVLVYLCDTYAISKEYNCNMWEVSADALSGKNGIWSHTSFRESGKWDIHPQPEIIKMFINLKNK